MKSLFGYGITTKEISKEGGWYIYDDNFKSVKKDEFGNTLLPSNEFNPKNSTLEITSPGIPPNHPLIKKANNLISEFDYFYENSPFQIWVTGSNGKTTTTQMIHYLLKDSQIGGNIGIPLARLNKNAPFWVIEASSFQLHYTKFAKPNIFIILPIKEDHISWHGSFENYVKAKLSPLKRMDNNDLVIMPKEFDMATKAKKILYSSEEDLKNFFNIKKTEFKTPFLLDELLAKAVFKTLFNEEKSLKNFKIDSHKLEEFKDKLDRVWVDDSKATNVDATLNALKRYKDKKIFLIIGGVDKGQDFTPLFDYMKNLDITLFIIGKNTNLFENLARKYSMNYKISKTLKNAVSVIDKLHSKKTIALLSPACASFDQFEGYKHRGKEFKNIVKIL